MPKNIFKKVFFFLPFILGSCSAFVQSVPSDVLYIGTWRERGVDFNPGGSYNFVPTEQVFPNAYGKRINPSIEQALEFSTAVGRDGSLYVAYATPMNVNQKVRVDAALSTAVSNIYTETIETLTAVTENVIYRAYEKKNNAYVLKNAETNEISYTGKVKPDQGVWVRLLRYNPSRPNNPWSVVFTTERPAKFSNITIAFVPGRTHPYIAAISNNNRLVIMGKPSSAINIEYILNSSGNNDLHNGRMPSSVSSPSTFNDGNRLYVSFIEDNRAVIGYVSGLIWQENYFDIWTGNVPSVFGMAANGKEIFGIWWDSSKQISTISSYQTNSAISRRWLLVNNLQATERPKIKSRIYFDSGIEKKDVYLGYTYSATKYFQLGVVSNNQIYTSPPPVDGYNFRYDFSIDRYGRLLYVRINSGNTIDVGTWTRDVWITGEQPQKILSEITTGTARVPFKTFPRSEITTEFMNDTIPIVLFIEDTGYLQMLEGVPTLRN